MTCISSWPSLIYMYIYVYLKFLAYAIAFNLILFTQTYWFGISGGVTWHHIFMKFMIHEQIMLFHTFDHALISWILWSIYWHHLLTIFYLCKEVMLLNISLWIHWWLIFRHMKFIFDFVLWNLSLMLKLNSMIIYDDSDIDGACMHCLHCWCCATFIFELATHISIHDIFISIHLNTVGWNNRKLRFINRTYMYMNNSKSIFDRIAKQVRSMNWRKSIFDRIAKQVRSMNWRKPSVCPSVRPSVRRQQLRLAVAFSLVSHKPLMIQESNLVSL